MINLSFIFFCLFMTLLGCQSLIKSDPSAKRATASQAEVVDSKIIFLDTLRLQMEEFEYFNSIISGAETNYTETIIKIKSLENKSQILFDLYHDGFARVMNVSNLMEFEERHPRAYLGIKYYVDDPGNMDVPYWQSINKKLRERKGLTKKEREVKEEILFGMQSIPSISGIVFRGVKFRPEIFAEIKAKFEKNIQHTELAFLSTSIDPGVAHKFSKLHPNSDDPNRISTLMILRIFKGSPMSIFPPDPAYRYEIEALLEPGSRFQIKKILESKEHPKAIIYMDQIQ